MRFLLSAFFCAVPLLAFAQEKIPEAALRQTYERCLPACEQTRSYAYCSNVCACVANEMSRHWTADEFRSKGASLSGNQGDGTPEAQVGRMAAACAERAQ